MSLQKIPTRVAAHYQQTTRLDGQTYIIQFDWHQRWGRWTIGLFDQDENPLILGLTLMPWLDLLEPFKHDQRLPQGILLVFGPDAPTYESLGPDGNHSLMYVTADLVNG